MRSGLADRWEARRGVGASDPMKNATVRALIIARRAHGGENSGHAGGQDRAESEDATTTGRLDLGGAGDYQFV